MHPKYKKFKQSLLKKTNKRIASTPFNFKYQYEREERTYKRFYEFEEESNAIRGKHSVKGDDKQSEPQKVVEATTTKLGKAYNELGGFKKLGEPFKHTIDYKQYKQIKDNVKISSLF